MAKTKFEIGDVVIPTVGGHKGKQFEVVGVVTKKYDPTEYIDDEYYLIRLNGRQKHKLFARYVVSVPEWELVKNTQGVT